MMSLYMGDASFLPLEAFGDALNSDVFVVFGASYLKGALVDFLVERKCINIHMGVSPYYRGSACNFWALADRRPELVGATIHFLSKGLDSGPILFHAMPAPRCEDGFMLGMRAVQAANQALADRISARSILSVSGIPQDRSRELRYSRSREFTAEIADDYMRSMLGAEELQRRIKSNLHKYELRNAVYI
jgi:methionyl-tRNA formyltransferase